MAEEEEGNKKKSIKGNVVGVPVGHVGKISGVPIEHVGKISGVPIGNIASRSGVPIKHDDSDEEEPEEEL